MSLIIQFSLYLLLMLGIGYYSMKKTKNNEDFIIGGRSLGPVTTAISAGASDMSSWLPSLDRVDFFRGMRLIRGRI